MKKNILAPLLDHKFTKIPMGNIKKDVCIEGMKETGALKFRLWDLRKKIKGE